MSRSPRHTGGRAPQLRRWVVVGLIALATIVVTILLSLRRSVQEAPRDIVDVEATFVSTAACRDCHRTEIDRWTGSDHDKAMDVATEDTVLGDFNDATFTYRGVTSRFYRRDGKFFVFTEGPGGQMAEFEITHVFGHAPLQQGIAAAYLPLSSQEDVERFAAIRLRFYLSRHGWRDRGGRLIDAAS